MRTPGSPSSRRIAVPLRFFLLGLLLCWPATEPSHAQSSRGAFVTPQYLNRLYTSTPTIPGVSDPQSKVVSFFSGHVGASQTTGSIPNNGFVFLTRSAFGQPVASPPTMLVGATVKFGEEIIPDSALQANGATPPALIDPPSYAVFIAGPNRVYAAAPGFVSISWKRLDGTTNTPVRYLVQSTPARLPVALYHTHVSAATLTNFPPKQTRAPDVILPADLTTQFHWNDAIPESAVADGIVNHFVLRNPQNNQLVAAETTGLILLEYRNAGAFQGLEIVELRSPNAPSGSSISSDIGDRLLPSVVVPDPAEPALSQGDDPSAPRSGGLNGFAYQHQAPGSQKGQIFAIKKTSSLAGIEIYWRMKGLLGVEWPYELSLYTADWPKNSAKYQNYVRGSTAVKGPDVRLPAELKARLLPFQEPANHAQQLDGEHFISNGPGWSLLKYSPGDGVSFQVVRSVLHNDTGQFSLATTDWEIGKEIVDASHAGPRGGYIHDPEGNRYDWETYQGAQNNPQGWESSWTTGQIFAVNKGVIEVWWSNVNPNGNVQWPSLVKRYNALWPSQPERIIIASTKGTGPISEATHKNFRIYYQNDPTRAGFNPNDEHAFRFTAEGGAQGAGEAIFALRDDLGTSATSEPYVLLKYQDPANRWRFRVFQVLAEGIGTDGTNYTFHYPAEAGKLIQPPYPLSYLHFLEKCAESAGYSGPFWRDRKLDFWARAAGDDDGHANIVMRYFYSTNTGLISGIYFPPNHVPAPGAHVPWLDHRPGGTPGIPSDITYNISWPDVSELRVGETLVKSKGGLPDISSQSSVEVIYQQAAAHGLGDSVKLIDPTQTVSITNVLSLPGDVPTTQSGGLTYFPTLPPHLRPRVWYDDVAKALRFRGLFEELSGGEYFLLLNVITERDRQELFKLTSDAVFRGQIDALAAKAAQAIVVPPNTPFDTLALTAGLAAGTGYVTLAFGNSTNLTPVNEPVDLKIIKVTCPWYQGELKVIQSDGPFDEKLTLRHSGDFAGRPEDYIFEWRTLPPGADGKPQIGKPPEQWGSYAAVPDSGQGALDITIEGAGLYTLTDNYFMCRYRPVKQPPALCTDDPLGWSKWTIPQLAPGWIKRVVGRINPFTQRAEGGGLAVAGAEARFAAFNKPVNTLVSMISQAGARFEGAVPFNAEAADKFGLIEIYESVLQRGIDLSIAGNPPVNYGPANDALLLAAGRLSDLYMLLGNEAYADASDPTIAFGTDNSTYGAEASSIHTFQNQTASLLDEELVLLRGRDDVLQPGVRNKPFYNRLIWNFTKGDGEVAYANNYGIRDNDANGVIDEADAKIDYPQGHGDAWGHYLSAIKGYYHLLRNTNFTWVPRTEAVLVGGVPVQVDYLDERKFAKAAAAKAQVGAEIVNLTYRSVYVEDPAQQWQGYPDASTNRAWGMSDWSARAGQAALFDWVLGNAILPSASPKTGIEKIDRTTVTELRDVVSAFQTVQEQADKADLGLNPLGLTKNSIPFDIDPSQINAGRTHFEQIYDRAVSAMNNAIAVFNHANNSSQALRRQADAIDDFQRKVIDQEADFNNRLIEVFGYPYPGDTGPTGSYAAGYDGPDLYHYMYSDPSALLGEPVPSMTEFTITISDLDVAPNGIVGRTRKTVKFHLASNGLGLVKPPTWTEPRRAPGEIQRAHSDLLQAKARFERALKEYGNLLAQIEDQAALLQAQYNLNAQEINILDAGHNRQESLNAAIKRSRDRQLRFLTTGRISTITANAVAEFLPKISGLDNDVTSTIRGAIMLRGTIDSEIATEFSNQESLAELDHQQAKELAQSQQNIQLTTLRQDGAILQQLKQLEENVRHEVLSRLELYTMQEAMQQASGNYMAALSRGQRIMEDRLRFRQQTAAQVQDYRYKDMAFRIFRNDALQKYRAQFDLAAMYVYLAAKAYDYETNLRPGDSAQAGREFLSQIARARTIGVINNGIPQTGARGDSGLADPMARMSANFAVLKTQLGFNNPQTTVREFSLRSQLLRVLPGTNSSFNWREALAAFRVFDLRAVPEVRQHCLFEGTQPQEPGLVIPFETTVNQDLNYFGKSDSLGGTFNPTSFSIKIRNVGVAFSNYRRTGTGALRDNPLVYLIPVGNDVARSPRRFTGDTLNFTREWKIIDQWLPTPFRLNGKTDPALNSSSWIPINSMQQGDQPLGDVRGHPAFEAWFDSSTFSQTEPQFRASRLIGRSVWNTHWLLVIPGVSLSTDRDEGINRFVFGAMDASGKRDGNGVADIKLRIEAYSHSGR